MAVITVSPSSGPPYDAAHRKKGRGRASRTLLSYGTQPAQRSPRNRPGWPTMTGRIGTEAAVRRTIAVRRSSGRRGGPRPRRRSVLNLRATGGVEHTPGGCGCDSTGRVTHPASADSARLDPVLRALSRTACRILSSPALSGEGAGPRVTTVLT